MQYITLSGEPHNALHSPSLFLMSKVCTWRDSPRMFVLSCLTWPLWRRCGCCSAARAIHVTFNLHVACSYEVSGTSYRGSKILFCCWKHLLTFCFSTRAQFVVFQFTAAMTRWVSTKCAFWNGSYSTSYFIFILRIFVVRKGIYLDQSFLLRFSVLMGSYLPRKKSPFGHLSHKVILLMARACLSHVITKGGRRAINIATF